MTLSSLHAHAARAALAVLTLAQLAARIPEPETCDAADISADTLECFESVCRLEGNAKLKCGALTLWAETIDIELTEDKAFDGALAHGNVVMVQRETVVRCTALRVGPDKIQTDIQQAVVQIKEDPSAVNAQGIPAGRHTFELRGNMERKAPSQWEVHEGDFTLCDCEDDPPSWRLRSPHIEANTRDRIVIWAPQLVVNALDTGTFIPLTPPLLPLSVTTKARDLGLLRPNIRFFGGSLGLLDIPLFIPLGDSYDLTVAPGMRFDWGEGLLNHPGRWGAPRLTTRFRYAPVEGTFGELQVEWTHDTNLRGAKARSEREVASILRSELAAFEDGLINRLRTLRGDYEPCSYDEPYCRLKNRVNVTWQHRTDFSKRTRWLMNAEWLSDDAILSDFRALPNEIVQNYTASRTSVMHARPFFTAALNVDFYQTITNPGGDFTAAFNPRPEPVPAPNNPFSPSNIDGTESGTPHRGPAVDLRLQPMPLWGPLSVDGSLSFTRYGAWSGAFRNEQNAVGQTLGISTRHRLGPVRLRARTGIDQLWLNPNSDRESRQRSWTVESELDTRLIAGGKSWAHLVRPFVHYRAAPYSRTYLEAGGVANAGIDERALRRPFQQIAFGVEQELLQGWRRTVRLRLSQPIDLESGQLLQGRGELDLHLGATKHSIVTGFAPHNQRPLRELLVSTSLPFKWVTFRGRYVKLAPDAERFRRSIFEWVAPRRTQPLTSAWIHFVEPSIAFQISESLSLGYLMQVVLPAPRGAPFADPDLPVIANRIHSLNYSSPCRCWGLGVTAVKPRLGQWVVNMNLTVGDYALGTEQ